MIVAAATKAFRPRGNSIDLYFAWRDLGLHIMFGLKQMKSSSESNMLGKGSLIWSGARRQPKIIQRTVRKY